MKMSFSCATCIHVHSIKMYFPFYGERGWIYITVSDGFVLVPIQPDMLGGKGQLLIILLQLLLISQYDWLLCCCKLCVLHVHVGN